MLCFRENIMKGPFEAKKVSEHVYWVGAIDWGMRDFHGYTTKRGSTYNAYLVLGGKNILIDTVKSSFRDEMLARISSLINPRDIDYIISNHSEPDHTGCLAEVIELVEPEKVFASVMGVKALENIFHAGLGVTAVKNGESMKLGDLNFTFLETRMLHWPDSMFTYLAEDELLFSQDAFGMHLATSERFADELSDDILHDEGKKYYANILTPYSALVTNLLKKVSGLDIKIGIIAPDHGPIWRGDDVGKVLNWWSEWAAQKPTGKAVILYGSMWGCTGAMARAIEEGLVAEGASVKVMPVESCRRSDAATEVLDAGALIVGSPTLNNNMLPAVADFLTYLRGLRPKNLVGAVFGSYGWSGEAVGQLRDILEGMKVELLGEIKANYMPDDEALARCRALGVTIAARLPK
jgi:flavorubredoxin